jgi:hypothetical protein
VFQIARDFCGYYAILHNLRGATITSSLPILDELATKLVALELIYTIVCRLTDLLDNLIEKIQALPKSKEGTKRYAVALYGLEIVYGCMKSYPKLEWEFPHDQTLFSLVSTIVCP